MGVRTTADEKLDSASEHITQAIDDLAEIIVARCWGADDYNEAYKSKVKQVFNGLLEARILLNRD